MIGVEIEMLLLAVMISGEECVALGVETRRAGEGVDSTDTDALAAGTTPPAGVFNSRESKCC